MTELSIVTSFQVEGEELTELLKLHDAVYEQANSWFTSLKDNMKSQILSHFGHLPNKDTDPQVRTQEMHDFIFPTDHLVINSSDFTRH